MHEIKPELEYEVDTTKACWRIRYELKKCLMESPCIKEDKWPAKKCLTDPDARIDKKCFGFINTYRACRRQVLDARARFRGRKGDF